jgi:DNA-directed RNA polymerase specialized sigma subunit
MAALVVRKYQLNQTISECIGNSLVLGLDARQQRDIARAVGCSQATVSRVVTKFHGRVRSRFKSADDITDH